MDEQLLALAERCEAATGPDRLLDCDIASAAFGWDRFNLQPGGPMGYPPGKNASYRVPKFTASIDAAMTLAPDEWEPFLESDLCGHPPRLFWKWGLGHCYYDAVHGRGLVSAAALAAASLRSRSHKGGSNGE